MDIGMLRRETAVDHDAVEGIMPLMSPSLNKEEYVSCLCQMYEIIAGWEDSDCAHNPEWLQQLLSTRKRKQLLERDLNFWGIHERSRRRPVFPKFNDYASLLGAMYVIEGSTLGGQLIARHVEQVLGMEVGQGASFFRGYGDRTGTMWKEFCEVLRVRVPDESAALVIQAAHDMFRAFGSWMQASNSTFAHRDIQNT